MVKPFQMIAASLVGFAELASTAASAQSGDKGPLQLEAKILLGDIDERNDGLTLRLANKVSGDIRVLDGLVFNAVRDGDQVEITVENIRGAKTIVGLKKE